MVEQKKKTSESCIAQRRYSRVEIECSAWLICDDERLQFTKVRDLSMGGICIQGETTLEPGDSCGIELLETRENKTTTYSYEARVVWKGKDRVALEFTNMSTESYMFLQTTVLYFAENPLDVVEEFQEVFNCRN